MTRINDFDAGLKARSTQNRFFQQVVTPHGSNKRRPVGWSLCILTVSIPILFAKGEKGGAPTVWEVETKRPTRRSAPKYAPKTLATDRSQLHLGSTRREAIKVAAIETTEVREQMS
jgi:hypothetical protein